MSVRILIDPGHGPGCANGGKAGYKEHIGMWQLSNHLKATLEERGIFAALTRTENESPSLTARGKQATGFDLFISEHSNASSNGTARGVEVYYSVKIPDDRAFAAALSRRVSTLMGNPDRGAKVNESQKHPGQDYFTVMLTAQRAGAKHILLIESGFHDNAKDEAFLLSDAHLKAIAEAQAAVIVEYIAGHNAPASQAAPTAQTGVYPLTETHIEAMQEVGVINHPDYWRGVTQVAYLDTLLANAAQEGVLDKRIDNGITDTDIAIRVLVDAGVISSPNYWTAQLKANTTRYLPDLLVKMANKSRIILEKIVQAEAGGEDEKGQILVANVILNRVRAASFPNGIYDVVFQHSGAVYQFSPISDGAYAKAQPSSSVKVAVSKALDRVDDSRGALFFRTIEGATADCWHERVLSRLFDHGAHRFYL